jgi:hypothetical protein
MGVGYNTRRTLLDIGLDRECVAIPYRMHVPVRAMTPYGAEELHLHSFLTSAADSDHLRA